MADTFTTSLSIRQIETGTRSGTWGSETNTQYELLDNAFSYVNHDLSSDANATLTISDGTASDARYFYIKFTSSVSLTATRTITLAPDDSKKIWIVENATTGSQSLTFKQGSSGGTVTVVNGNTAVIYADGAGATNGAITNAFTDLQLAGTTSMSVATISGDLTVDTNTLYVDSTNNKVGVGTSSPTGKLEIAATGTNAAPHIKLVESGDTREFNIYNDGSGNGRLVLADTDDTPDTEIVLADNGIIQFKTANTERATIDASGHVGIGGTPTTYPLEVFDTNGNGIAYKDTTNSVTSFVGAYNSVAISGTLTNHPYALWTNNTERLRIDTSGSVGIGTTSPSSTYKLDIAGKQRIINNDDTAAITLERTAATTGVYYLGIDGDGAYRLSSTSQVHQQIDDQGISYYRAYTDMTFGTGSSGTERMRIDSSGNLLHSTTDSNLADNTSGGGTVLQNGGGFQSAYTGNVGVINRMGSDGSTLEFRNRAVVVGSVSTTSSSTAYNTSSDARLKDVIGEARGLEVINKLNPVSYNWKADGKADEGLIAQEVLEIVPNAVSGSEEEYYQMDYSKLVTHLVAGMKEQQVLIEQLQAEVALLKGE